METEQKKCQYHENCIYIGTVEERLKAYTERSEAQSPKPQKIKSKPIWIPQPRDLPEHLEHLN